MRSKSQVQKELVKIKKEIKETQDYLDELIVDFNRKNLPEDEVLIKKARKQVEKLISKKKDIESELSQL